MKKLTKKLMLSILTVALTFIALGTSTFAWFSMNNRVTVTGMQVNTKVNDNLFIVASSANNNKTADSSFKIGLHQSVTGTLQPASTINGLAGSFFTTTDAAPDGSKLNNTTTSPYEAATGTNGDTITIDSTDYKAYVDYVFELKAINASDSPKYVNLTSLNLLYNGTNSNVTHAFRVAILSQAQANPDTTLATTAVADAYAAISTTAADKIYAPTGFAYFETNQAVKTTTTKDTVSPAVNNGGWYKEVGAGKTLYFKVTVRLWLEGEDTDCYNTKFVDLTEDWTLDLEFKLEAANTSAVTSIGSAITALATVDGSNAAKATAALSGTVTSQDAAASYLWYNAATGAAAAGTNNAAEYTATADGDFYCVITTAKGTQYRTNTVTLDAQ